MVLIVWISFLAFAGFPSRVYPTGIQLWLPGRYAEKYEPSNAGSDRYIFIKNETGIYVPARNRRLLSYTIACEAEFPIQWKIKGDFNSSTKIHIPLFKRTKGQNGRLLYTLSFWVGYLFGYGLIEDSEQFMSATFSCHSINNATVAESVDVFSEGKTIFTGMNSMTHGKSYLSSRNTVPCSVTNPSVEVELLKYDALEGKNQPVNSTEYIFNPRIGFTFPEVIEGDYTCKHLNESVQFSLAESQIGGFYHEPAQRNLKFFWDEHIKITCGKVGNDIGSHNKVVIRQDKSLTEDELSEVVYITRHNVSGTTVSWIIAGKDYPDVGKNYSVWCEDYIGRTIWAWEITLLGTPKAFVSLKFEEFVSYRAADRWADKTLTCCSFRYIISNQRSERNYKIYALAVPGYSVDNANFDIACAQNFDYIMKVRLTECHNPVDCASIMDQDISDRANRIQAPFCDQIESCRSTDGLQSQYPKYCAFVPFNQQHGILECQITDRCGATGTKRWIFFVTLENTIKEITEHVEPHEIIRMDEIKPFQYTNKISTFICRAVTFWFTEPLTMELVFRNGTSIPVQPQLRKRSNDAFRQNATDYVHLVLEAALDIVFPQEASAIRCHGWWWNSSESAVAEQQFITLYQFAPVSQFPKENLEIILRKSGQMVNCNVIAEPTASFIWLRNEQIVIEGPDFEIEESAYQSLLKFMTVQDSLLGEWICSATNKHGTVNIPFKIVGIVNTEYNSATYTILIASIGVLLSVLTVLGIAYRFIRHRKSIDDRDLSDREVQEFFDGNPDCLVTSDNVPEHLSLLPYNRNYEIEASDLEFVSLNVLGSGAFGTVIEGKRTSVNETVAVKVAKPSADAELFKSLLLEVKIMIFLGKHPHIVNFIGACTSQIQTRRIHIVMEMCNRGSLLHLLRNSKSKFCDLWDEKNDKIHFLTTDDPDVKKKIISTLDLIRWSGEISLGMEYLAHKGVIHADLAARNVLINEDYIAKISDFGLSRRLYENCCYTKKTKCPLPWRSMAIESLQNLTFSSQSDVWSFGLPANI